MSARLELWARTSCQWCHAGEGLAGLRNVGKAYEELGLVDERLLRGSAQ